MRGSEWKAEECAVLESAVQDVSDEDCVGYGLVLGVRGVGNEARHDGLFR